MTKPYRCFAFTSLATASRRPATQGRILRNVSATWSRRAKLLSRAPSFSGIVLIVWISIGIDYKRLKKCGNRLSFRTRPYQIPASSTGGSEPDPIRTVVSDNHEGLKKKETPGAKRTCLLSLTRSTQLDPTFVTTQPFGK